MADKSFSQYLAAARAKQRVSSAKAVPQKPLDFSAFKSAPSGQQDPLSWLIDIASRPMRTIQNVPNQILNEALKRQEAEKTGQEYDVLGSIGNIVTSPVRGFFSTNPEDQPTGAQLIEKTTDVIGQSQDRNYKNVENNANEIAKGIGGFALDVALDPLTYLPYGIIAAGARGGIAAAKAATGAEKISAGFKGIVQGTPDAFKLGSITKRVKPVGINQWKDLRDYEKLHKVASRQGLTADELLKVANGAKASDVARTVNQAAAKAAKEAGTTANKISGKTISEILLANEKLVAGAKNIRKSEEAAMAKAASNTLAKAAQVAKPVLDETPTEAIAKAEANIPANVTTPVDMEAAKATAMLDELGPPVGSTEREQFAAAGAPQKVSDTLGLIKPTEVAPKVAPKVSGMSVEDRITFNAGKDPYSDQIRQLKGKLAKLENANYMASESADARRLSNIKKINSEISSLEKQKTKYLTDQRVQFEAEAKAAQAPPAKLSASSVFRELLKNNDTVATFNEALSPSVVSKLAGITNDKQLSGAVKYLQRVVAGEAPKTSSKLYNELAQGVREHYDVKIPGTNANRIQETTSGGTTETAVATEMANSGETLGTSPWLAGFSEEAVDTVFNKLPKVLRARFERLKGFKDKGIPQTKTGALRSSATPGKGTAEYENIFGTRDQVDMYNASLSEARKRINEANTAARRAEEWGDVTAGVQRSSIIWKEGSENLNLMLKHLDSLGATVWMGEGANTIRLYLDQLIDSIRTIGNPHMVNISLLNLDTQIPPTNFFDAFVAPLLRENITDAELSAILRRKVSSVAKNEPYNMLTAKSGTKYYGHLPRGKRSATTTPKHPLPYMRYVPNIDETTNRLKGWYGQVIPEKYEKELIKFIREKTDELRTIVADNEVMAKARVISDEKYLAPVVKERLEKAMAGGEELGDAIRETANIHKMAANIGADNRITPEAQRAATKMAVDSTPADQIHAAQTYTKGEKVYHSGKPAEEMAEDLKRQDAEDFNYYERYGAQLVDMEKSADAGYAPDGSIVDEALNQEAKLRAAVNLSIASKLDGFFNIKSGVEDVIHPYKRTEVKLLSGVNLYKQELESVVKNPKFSQLIGDTPIYDKAFRDIALGIDDPLTRECVAALRPMVERVFGTMDKDRAVTSLWMQGKATFKDLEAYMYRAKIESPFEIDIIKKEAKKTGLSEVEVALNNWGTWAVNQANPLDFLEKMHYGASLMIADKAAAQLFSKIDGATSAVAMPGFVKMPKDLNPLDNPFLSHMPKDTFINEELLGQVRRVEQTAMGNRSYTGPFADFINNKYLPVLGNWKFGITVLRLGHHLRNFFSDESIQMLEEGLKYYARSGVAAHQVMMAMRSYEGVDFAKTLQSIGELSMPTAGTRIMDFRGKPITTMAIHEAADKHGLFINVAQVEDILGDVNTPGFIQKASNVMALRGTFIAKKAGNLSEYQNHYNRLHHFIQILMKEKNKGIYKNWDELVEAAAIKTRKYHPDSSMLSNKEAKLRLLFPFYSWFRLAGPVILESIIANPGRFMTLPKASYNMAVAMGINPQSIQEPFPKDQLFPSFLTEQLMGPVIQVDGKYYGINPGLAPVDIMNMVSNPLKAGTGMLTPMVKMPIELMTGTQLGTGVKIKDYSDYVDNQIPGINYLSNISGTSVTGSIVSGVSGQGLDPQYAVDAGNKTPIDQMLTTGAWFSGISVTNMSKPNYINLAEIEKRNREARAADEAAGTARSPF